MAEILLLKAVKTQGIGKTAKMWENHALPDTC